MRIKNTPRYIRIVAKSLRGRTYTNYHNGKPLHKTVANVFRKVRVDGVRESLRHLKRVIVFSSSSGHLFPNGLVSSVNTNAVRLWFSDHSKKVSIVIPSYNDLPYLKDCIDSIKRNTPVGMYHIFIVDDYCDAENAKNMKKLGAENITFIFRRKNGGFAKAVNTGLRAALKKYSSRDVVLVNSDIVAHAGWLQGLEYGAYQHGKNVGIVGPKLLYPDGRIQSAGSYRNTESPEWFDHYYRFQPENYGPANVPQYCIAVTGACMYIKNSTIKKIGLLDEGYQFAFEDVDYCLRAWEEDIKTLYYPASTLTHVESASRPKNKSIKPKEKASVTYFWQKWASWFDERKVTDADGRIRIIYVLQTTGISGGIRIVLEHVNRLSKMGYSVELWSLDTGPTWAKLNVPHRGFKNYEKLTEELSNEDAIKVATWWETAHPVWISAVRRGIPVYYIQEIESWFYPNDQSAQSAVISCYRKEFINMTTSNYNLEEIRSLGLNATPIPCGYDQTVFCRLKNISRSDDILLAVGRSFFQKNLKQTLEAWKLIGAKRPRLLMFGSEPELAKDLEKSEYIMKPSDDEVNTIYNKATVFMQTSYHEGFCLPILEAMAAGCPVICTDSHGNRDFSINGKNCLVVEKDDINATKEAIEQLFNDAKLRDKFSKAGLETAKKYQWPVVIKQVGKFYEDTAKQQKAHYIKSIIKQYK